MTATDDLIAMLNDIGQRQDGLGRAARGHARRFHRPARYSRLAEDRLHKLEGFVDLADALELLERNTAYHLATLVAAAWQEAVSLDREGSAQ